jgi:hypothetical protein
MPTVIVNPMNETRQTAAGAAPRLSTLAGKTIGLLDISKPGGGIFLDRMEGLLKNRYGVARIVRAAKPTFTKRAPSEVIAQLRDTHAVIEALAD